MRSAVARRDRRRRVAAPHRGRRPPSARTGPVRRRTVRSVWFWVFALTAVVAVGALVGWLLWVSPFLRLQTVRVEGAPEGRHAAVVTAVDPAYGQPLVEVDLQAAADRVASMRLFATVRTRREWPGTLVVDAVPRRPAVGLVRPGGQVQLVDREAVAYETVATAPPGLVTAMLARPGDPQARRAAVLVAEALTPDLRSKLEGMSVDASARSTLTIRNVQVRWGTPDDGRVKAAVVEALLKSGSPALIDVTSPLSPVTRDDLPGGSASSGA